MPYKDPKKRVAATMRWRQTHREEYNASARAYNNKRYQNNPQRVAKLNRKLKEEVLAAYGNRCACCGVEIAEFLSIDHKKNDGAKHRREIGSGFYRWLKRNGFPQEDFQCLCMNCQFGRHFCGVCPHQAPCVEVPNVSSQSS